MKDFSITVLISKWLRTIGKYDIAKRLLRQKLSLQPASVAAFREYCINRMAVRDFSAIKEHCSLISQLPYASDSLKDEAAAFLTRSSLDDNADPHILSNLQNNFRRAAQNTVQFLNSGDTTASRETFKQAITLARIPDKAAVEWNKAFQSLINSESPSPVSVIKEPCTAVPKIVVSGMYWSGSGAIYDYLREFDQISAVDGELRLWKEGDFCLNALENQLADSVNLRKGLLRLLTVALAGISPVSNWQEELAVRYALSCSREDLEGEYARSCRLFIEDTLALVNGTSDASRKFISAASTFSDRLAGYWTNSSPNTVLLDNVVHIGAIKAIRLLGEARALCSFRDPRSNFVARWYENPRFHRDVDRFISYYRATRQSFDQTITDSPEIAACVTRVRFEDFIKSADYRDSIAVACGLDLKRRKKGLYFKPDASKKNILNYSVFPDQYAIRKIEKELDEYCVE